jgi:hypothetical protein
MEPTRKQVLDFLRGSGSLRGRWFGEGAPEGQRGSYWWRRDLDVLDAPPAPVGFNDAAAAHIATACAAALADAFRAGRNGTVEIDLGPVVREAMGLPPLADPDFYSQIKQIEAAGARALREQEERDHNGGYTIAEEQARGVDDMPDPLPLDGQ